MVSHVIGLLRFCKSIIYLVVLAVDSVSTAALQQQLFVISLNSVPCLTVRTKELREFKQGLVCFSGECLRGKLYYHEGIPIC